MKLFDFKNDRRRKFGLPPNLRPAVTTHSATTGNNKINSRQFITPILKPKESWICCSSATVVMVANNDGDQDKVDDRYHLENHSLFHHPFKHHHVDGTKRINIATNHPNSYSNISDLNYEQNNRRSKRRATSKMLTSKSKWCLQILLLSLICLSSLAQDQSPKPGLDSTITTTNGQFSPPTTMNRQQNARQSILSDDKPSAAAHLSQLNGNPQHSNNNLLSPGDVGQTSSHNGTTTTSMNSGGLRDVTKRISSSSNGIDNLSTQSTQLVSSALAVPQPNDVTPKMQSTSLSTSPTAVATVTTNEDSMVASASKKKKKMMKKKKKMEKKHKEWKKGKKHKKKKYESKKKKGGMEKKKKGKKEKKKWGMEKKGHKKKGNFKKKKWGHKKKMKKGHKKGKKGHKMLKDKGHKKKGFKKVYHKEEWGKKKKWHDIKREKKWNTKQKKWKKKWHQEKGKKYKGKHMKKYHKKNKHGKKYKKEKKSKYKKHKGEKFKKGHKKKKEEYAKKKEGGKKKKMKKFKKEEKKKKKG